MCDSDTPLYRFGHEAMNTPFEVVIAHEDETYAGQAAMAVFREVDRIEGLLSRFNPCSDVGQINLLDAGLSTGVEPEVLDCLLIANEVFCETGGAFDVTIGPAVQCRRDDEGHPVEASDEDRAAALARVGMSRLVLNFDEFSVGVKGSADGSWPGRVVVDLGGIGKGFALDRVVETLTDWSIDNALIHGGTSTALVVGSGGSAGGCGAGVAGWALGVGADWGPAAGIEKVVLRSGALSGSGVELQGEHIIDPRTGRPALTHVGAWAICPSAARADALSTAFVVMATDQVEAYCDAHDDTAALVVPRPGLHLAGEGTLLSFGLDKLQNATVLDRA